jgi:DNA replication and repair protein RecF
VYVSFLSLADFRSYPELDLPLDPGVTVLLGPNGQGKTNLVEAVGYVATLGSHRVATDAPLVRQGAERAIVRAQVVRDGRTTLAEIEINPGKANRARLNRTPLPRAREVLGVLRVVVFAPEDLALVKGDPSERRRFVDELLTARAPRLAGVRQDYDRVLKQRNALLRSAAAMRGRAKPADLPTLDVWDEHLSTAGAELLAARLAAVDALAPLVGASYEGVAPGRGPATVTYTSSLQTLLAPGEELPRGRPELAELLGRAILEARKAELERGTTLVGPHRDDLVLALGGLPARGYASHGESWSFALALRLASFDLLGADGGEPVLVLDDVFAELDLKRRAALVAAVVRAEQVLVTAAVEDDVPPDLSGARVQVRSGEAQRV